MRKIKQILFAGAVMVAAMCHGGNDTYAATDDYSATYTNVGVNKVDDINDLLNVSGNGINNYLTEVTTIGTYNYYYTFKLNKPSYVKFKSVSRAVEYNFQADVYVSLSSSKTFDEGAIISAWMNGESKTYSTALEAGTYYIKVNCDIHNNSVIANRYFNMGIYAEESSRTGSNIGTSMKKHQLVLINQLQECSLRHQEHSGLSLM